MINIKPLRLNKLQQDRFLSILKDLFSDFYSIEFVPETCDNCMPNTLRFKKTKEEEDGILIHWYELCINFVIEELALKLNPSQGYNDSNSDDFCDKALEAILLHEKHPVNYLYEKYLGN